MSAESVSNPVPILLSAESKKNSGKLSFLQQTYQFFSVAALGLASYFVISHYILQSVQVVGESMVPTLYDSQQYLLNKWIYYFRSPARSEVVVLKDPIDKGFAVKRIIGSAGDQIYIKNGQVFVNGQRITEPYLSPGTPTFPFLGEKEQSFTLGNNQFFVMGDNRKNSADSRTYGPVSRGSIIGLIIR